MSDLSPAAILYDANGDPITVINDGGSVRRLAGINKVLNVSGVQVNPSTEETSATRASESTLLTADGRLTTIDSVLDSIKDTDGVKKITDQLPEGTNQIGSVAQGTKAVPSAAWPEYIVDSTGNVVGVVLDSSIYRLQADAKVAKGASDLVHLESLDVSSGVGRLKTTIYTQDGHAAAFPASPPSPTSIKNAFVENGGSSDLLVDGSTTAVVFTFQAHGTCDTSIQEIKFVMASNAITFGSDKFGAMLGPLSNGLLIEITANAVSGTIATLYQNEDFVNFASPGGFDWVVSSKDLMASTLAIGGGLNLEAGTGDNVKVSVRDDLTSAGVYLRCFVKGMLLS